MANRGIQETSQKAAGYAESQISPGRKKPGKRLSSSPCQQK